MRFASYPSLENASVIVTGGGELTTAHWVQSRTAPAK